ncbi:hypothetical protein [Kitasatospora sp. NBC_01302]|nr:hypothetical protein OG294_00385 [Kitasatospora sp. NBC_01302]
MVTSWSRTAEDLFTHAKPERGAGSDIADQGFANPSPNRVW